MCALYHRLQTGAMGPWVESGLQATRCYTSGMSNGWRYGGIAFCLFSLLFISQARVVVDTIPQVGAVIASVVVELTNGERAEEGLGTLSHSDTLTRAAEAKARDMAAKGYFAHVSPDGTTPWKWMADVGYTFVYAGENLAIDFDESPDVVRAWMASPSHRANIVGTQFSEIGVAVVDGVYEGRPATFVVQMFGTPRPGASASATAEPSVASALPLSTFEIDAEQVALATTLAGEPPTELEVLGQSAGAVLEGSLSVPWWYRVLAFLGLAG